MVSDQLITSHGALKRVWIASCWERKISKSQFLQTNLQKTIGKYSYNSVTMTIIRYALDAITTNDQEPLTLRMSGQLLLGVVRIHSRKTRYLLEDCNGALEKIKQAFKKGDVNMPDIRHAQVKMKSITLPDRLTEFDVLLPDDPLLDLDMDGRDPILDSLSQMASSQDITLSDISFGWDMHNPTAEQHDVETGRLVGDGDFHGVEQGRRDNEAMLDQGMDTSIGDIENPLAKGHYDDGNMLDFDDFDFGNDDFGDIAPPEDDHPGAAAAEETFPALSQTSEMDSSLIQSGLIRDDDDMAMFDAPEMNDTVDTQPPRRRRRLVVDRVTEIPHEQLRKYAKDASAIVDRSANDRQHVAPKTAIHWKKPMMSTAGTTLDAMYSRLSHPKPVIPAMASPVDNDLDFDIPAPAPELPRNDEQDYGDVGGMDFDFDDFGDTGFDGQQVNDIARASTEPKWDKKPMRH
ncbi:hypothetical protein K492DRAFT_186895 [Lichtheimia hyalospora FSU 10163]|nr:hypothetical protein K492DRAFT_186895 [Lichtheimia hyalospora FSU 10163]